MLIDRPQVVEGSSIQNASVATGTAFPSSPNIGELFYLTGTGAGLYSYGGTAWEAVASSAALAAHLADDTRHLTPDQNTLLDGITVTFTDINTIPTLTSRVGTVETNLTNHIADTTKHLTVAQNTFMDGLNLPTLTAAHVNFVAGVTSNIQTQLNAITTVNNDQATAISDLQSSQTDGQDSLQSQLNAHIDDDTRHLTTQQNTLLDGITVDFTQINRLNGIAAYLDTFGAGTSIATRLSAQDQGKLNIDGTKAMTGALNMGGNKIINLASPTLASDAATKDYVDSFVQGLHWVGSTRVATTANITLSGLQTIDGITVVSGNRVLVKNQTDTTQNGIWVVSNTAWSRAGDFNSAMEVNNSAVFVLEGTTQGKSTWVQLSTVANVSADPITWSAFSGPVINSAGAGISLGTGGMVSVVQGRGLTFDGNAVITDLATAGGLMHTQDNATSSTDPSAQLALTNVGTAGTYRSVTTDAKGRVTAGTNPTTISGYGITDALNKTGDTMTGNLSFTGGTAIYTTAPANGGTWFSTAPYGTGQGDNRTHFGYNASGQLVNYIRGVLTTNDGNMLIGGALTVTGAVSFNSTATVLGSTIWTAANLTNLSQLTNGPGYVTSSGTIANATTAANLTGFTIGSRSSADANSYRTNGHYAFESTPANASNAYGSMIVASNSDVGLQVAGGYVSDNLYFRGWHSSGATFTPWRVVWHSGNLAGPSVTSTASTLVQRDASGHTYANYGFVNYINSVDSGFNGDAGTVTSIMTKRGDNYLRATTAGSVKSFLQILGNEVITGINDTPRDIGVAKMLRWKNYGDGHVIFDASAGTSPTGSAVNRTNAAQAWTTTYPTLMGWNGSESYGVRVDSARVADSAGSASSATTAASATLATKASTLSQSGGTGSGMTFNWSGVGGQPSWLWGGNDGINMYVYNPSNFSVSYASSAGGVAWSNVSSRPTDLSAFGNSPGYIVPNTANQFTAVQSFIGNYNTGSGSGSMLQVISNNGSGAVMGFHRQGNYAVNMGLDSDNIFRIGGWSAAANLFQMDMSGNLTMLNNITAYSDERLKTNWRPLPGGFVEDWAHVKHGIYDRVDTGETQVGMSAQAVREVLPEAVLEMRDGYLTVNYGAAAAVATIELANEVVALKAELKKQAALIKLLMEKIG